MGKYKKLISNTLLFGVATFSSKILTFAMMPILTRLMPDASFSTGDLIVSTCNFIVPIISLSIHEAVIRFGLEKSVRKSDVFTTAVTTILCGYLALLLCFPLLGKIPIVGGHRHLIYLFVFTSAMRSTVTHFVRSSGFVRIFALDGLFTTAATVGLMFLLIAKLDLGIDGYVLSTIIADAVSAFGLIILLRLYRFFRPFHISSDTRHDMLRYSIPLVPTAIFWWITNLSDRYLVATISGESINARYAAAYRIPTVITLVSTIFIQAWQISAFSEQSEKERVQFYSTVFTAYYTLVFVAASGLILLCKPIATLMIAYDNAWRYIPFLVLAVAFSCLVTFLGTIYNVAKNNRMASVTTFVGAVLNIALNLLLIPRYEANGAAFATFVSYFIVFIIRAVDTRKYIVIRVQPLRIGFSLCLLLVQIWACLSQFMIGEARAWIAVEMLIFLLLVLCNLGPILYILNSLGRQLKRRRVG